jgi:hypothetical protein
MLTTVRGGAYLDGCERRHTFAAGARVWAPALFLSVRSIRQDRWRVAGSILSVAVTAAVDGASAIVAVLVLLDVALLWLLAKARRLARRERESFQRSMIESGLRADTRPVDVWRAFFRPQLRRALMADARPPRCIFCDAPVAGRIAVGRPRERRFRRTTRRTRASAGPSSDPSDPDGDDPPLDGARRPGAPA